MQKLDQLSSKNSKEFKTNRVRKWFFTLWNPEFNFGELYSDFDDVIKFVAGQKEKCPKSGKIHWQGCIHFFNPKTLGGVRRLLGLKTGIMSGDLRNQRGNNFQVLAYIHKNETFVGERFLFGVPSMQGRRTDQEDIKKRLENMESVYDIAQDHWGEMSKNSSYFQKYQGWHLEKLSRKWRKVHVDFIVGPTGQNKTRRALYTGDSNIMDPNVYKINCNELRWFDGYRGQKTLLLDEFKNQVTLTRLLDLLDGHQCRLEYKGGHTYALWDKIIITTNLRMCQVYPNISHDLRAPLLRRITNIIDLYDFNKNLCNEVAKGNTTALAIDCGDHEYSDEHSHSGCKVHDHGGYDEDEISSDFDYG